MKKTILGLSAACAMALPCLSMAADISGPVMYDYTGIYSGTSTQLVYDEDDSPYSSLPVHLICIDHTTNPPFVDAATPVPIAEFETNAGARAIKGPSGAAGEAAIYWLLDQYYESHFKLGSPEQKRALQYALWEIGNDYNGTAASINTASGASQPDSEDITDYGGTDQDAFISAYTGLYEAMRANLPTLGRNYRSSIYTMDVLRNRNDAYQHMVAVIEETPPPVTEPTGTPTPVPSLGHMALLALTSMLGLLGMGAMRRRKQ